MRKLLENLTVICALLSVILYSGCKEKTEEEETPFLIIAENQLQQQFDALGDSIYVTVKTNRDFTAVSSQAWCTAEVIFDKAENLKITVTENKLLEERTADIVVASIGSKDIRIKVIQQAGIYTPDFEKERGAYLDKFDPIADAGQYNFPEMTTKPKKYLSCIGALVGDRYNLGKTSETGVQNFLLCQSLCGLVNRAVDEQKTETGIWLKDYDNRNSYALSLEAIHKMGVLEEGTGTGRELVIKMKDLIDGYILTDVANNPESNIVASVASHVYNAIIVDVIDKAIYDAAGFEMKYDARNKTTRDSWTEFKDRCNKKALIVMPVQTGELRDYAIKNNLFVLNINKQIGTSGSGQNLDVFEEALSWLEPGAPVFGWEQGVSEDVFVNRASRKGHIWITCDWLHNLTMTSLQYKSRQTSVLAKVENPKNIDYAKKKNYVSFFLTDGDNVMWVMNDFVENFYSDANSGPMKMGYGIPVGSLAMVSPPHFANILNLQKEGCTLIESLGGGYSYVDNFGVDGNRTERLESLARTVSAHMRQHRVKILNLMARDVRSMEAKKGFQAFVDANDQLEGIIAIQYSPYAGGAGNIFWIRNKNGFDIPVITVKYSLWNQGAANTSREGTPCFVANRLKSEAKEESFSAIAVHAWSNFRDIGNTNDELAENSNGDKKGASAAKLCINHLDETFEVVSIQELVWRIRMFYREDQTKQYLNVIY